MTLSGDYLQSFRLFLGVTAGQLDLLHEVFSSGESAPFDTESLIRTLQKLRDNTMGSLTLMQQLSATSNQAESHFSTVLEEVKILDQLLEISITLLSKRSELALVRNEIIGLVEQMNRCEKAVQKAGSSR